MRRLAALSIALDDADQGLGLANGINERVCW